MVSPLVNKYFNKFGFSKDVLQVLSNSVLGSLGENPTDEEIQEACTKFEDLAKAMQSERDSKVRAAQKSNLKKNDETGEDSEEDKGNSEDSDLVKTIQKLSQKIEDLERRESSKTFNQKVSESLKQNHNLSDAQINSLLYGREFVSEDQANEFLEAQKGFFEDIPPVETPAGFGYNPKSSKGSSSQVSIEDDIKDFNSKY